MRSVYTGYSVGQYGILLFLFSFLHINLKRCKICEDSLVSRLSCLIYSGWCLGFLSVRLVRLEWIEG